MHEREKTERTGLENNQQKEKRNKQKEQALRITEINRMYETNKQLSQYESNLMHLQNLNLNMYK